MSTRNALDASEIGDRSRDFECPVVAARRQTEPRDRALQYCHAVCVESAMAIDLTGRKHRIGPSLPCKHSSAGGLDAYAYVIG